MLALSVALILTPMLPPPASAQDAQEHLRAVPVPHFRAGHTLPPLSRWGGELPFDVRVALTEHWGYALEFGSYHTTAKTALLADPNSVPSRILDLSATNPKRYPLCVLTHRPLLDPNVLAALPESAWCHNEKGARPQAPLWKLWSPEAPDRIFERAAAGTVAALKRIRQKVPIAIVLNGGEYGLSVYGHSGQYWQADPTVLKARGGRTWLDYISTRKAHQEMLISNAVRELLPDRTLYLWYHYGGLPSWDPWQWAYSYGAMRGVSDLPDQSLYFKHYNSGWTGDKDLLTNALHAAGQCLRFGDSFAYNWLCGGWLDGKLSDSERYMGFIKCLYTTGMLGAVAGYFSHPPGGFGADLGPEVPSWLWQITHLARAHALFSHLEDFIRDGDLLPGPNKHRRAQQIPAHEFPTGFANTRIVCRKHRKQDAWLLTAWAADGVEREVKVDIPGLGSVQVTARACGSVYVARMHKGLAPQPSKIKLRLVDTDGMLPSQGL